MSLIQRSIFRSTGRTAQVVSTRSFKRGRDPEDPHQYYKWGYKPLPVQTSLDVQNPQLAIQSPVFKLPSLNRNRLTKRQWRKKMAEMQEQRDPKKLEELARNRKLFILLDKVESEWKDQFGLVETNKLARFYGINKDLFGSQNVVLKTMLDVEFNNLKVHRGNYLQVKDVLEKPLQISFEADDKSFYTIILSNPDGYPVDSQHEIVHWMVSNFKKTDVSTGQTIHKYLPPLPWKGTCFHRLVFSLYKHSQPITLEENSQQSLGSRCFSTKDFIGENNDVQPIALAWFQCEWDESVSELCKSITDLNGEPEFNWNEYTEPKEVHEKLLHEMTELRMKNM